MGNIQQVGARYVPKFADPMAWSSANEYEALTVVSYYGTSYTSKKPVPRGVDIGNTEYWAQTGNFNAQIEALNKKVESLSDNAEFVSVLEYGADPTGVNDSTAAIQKALSDVKNIIFPAGVYKLNGVTMSSNKRVRLDGATIVTSGKAFVGGGFNNVIFDGVGAIQNNGERFAQFTNCNNVRVAGAYAVTGSPAQAAFEFYGCRFVDVSGLYTNNASLILCVGCSNVKVHDIHAVYTANAMWCISITRVDSVAYHDIEVYNCFIDGGNLLSVAAINISVDVPGGGTFNPANNDYTKNYNINIHDNTVMNCVGQCDGIDALFANDVIISRNIVKNCLEGIAVLSNNVAISDCLISTCRGVGVAFGDPSLGSGGVNYSSITLTNCTIAGNGTGAGDAYKQPKANIGFIQHTGGYVASVYITNCMVFGADYGLYANANAGGSNIVVTNSFIYGNSESISVVDAGQFYFSGIPTYNRRGLVTPPNPSTENVTNNTGTDIEVHIINAGAADITVYLNDVGIFGVKPNTVSTFTLYAGAMVKVSSTDNCVWTWQVL